MACLDYAVWDALGTGLGVPLVKIWCGYHAALPIVAIGGYYGNCLAELGQEMERYLALGLTGCKFEVGGASPEEDAARVCAVRQAAGPDFVLMVDANQGYPLEQAVCFARLTADLNLR
jgi:D-arabinonate dehydratase